MELSRHSTFRLMVGFAVLCLVTSAVALAQSTYGTINGSVTDPSSAAVRGATVEATNQQTQVKHSLVTSTEGTYRFVNLDPGVYTVSASAPGFSVTERKDVTLQAREELPVDLQLAVASAAATTVEVIGTPVIAEQLTRSDSKSGDAITDLPLNFRATASPSPIVVADLAPGVETDSGGNITIAGQLPTATSFSLDGISTQLPRYGGPTHDLFPSVEGIAEFRVNTASNSAEFSQATDITVISKSGSNEFHGGAFWYFQRQDMNSADPISGIIPTGDANTFGTSIGGPVLLPHVYDGKNKTFFYFDYEGVRLDSNTLISANTPPTAWVNGDFSGAGAIIDGLNGQPLPGNKVPASQINAVSAKLIPSVFPTPTSSETALTSPNLVTSFPGNLLQRRLRRAPGS